MGEGSIQMLLTALLRGAPDKQAFTARGSKFKNMCVAAPKGPLKKGRDGLEHAPKLVSVMVATCQAFM